MVASVDDAVGKVMDALEAEGVADNTLVIFTGDNGGWKPTRNDPLRDGKGAPWEGGVREPWLITFPGVLPAGQVSDLQISTIDIFPTVCAVAGMPLPEGVAIDGENVLPALLGEGDLKREALFWHYPHVRRMTYDSGKFQPVAMVRSGKWKLVRWHLTGEEELYDLDADLGETQNVSRTHPEVLTRLSALLDEHLKEVNARIPKVRLGDSEK